MALITREAPKVARHGKTDGPKRIDYPDSDGEPMAETDLHRKLMVSLISALTWRYRDEPLVYVSGNLLIYHVEGDPDRSFAPDVFVVRGVPARDRRTYLMWEEGAAPCVVIELTSRKTRRKDTQVKPALYASLGIREYFLFDPLEEYLRPSLRGLRLGTSGYEEIAPEPDGSMHSEELGLRLSRADWRLRLWDPVTGTEVLDDQRRAEAAEAELARLRVLLGTDQGADKSKSSAS